MIEEENRKIESVEMFSIKVLTQYHLVEHD